MQIKDLKKQLFTIPNILTYIRILMVPVIIWLTVDKSTYIATSAAFPAGFPIYALIAMLATSATDLVDGYIARRFNMVSDLGKMIDPLADKLMHIGAVLGLTIAGHIHWAFVALLAAKELFMIIFGMVLAGNAKLIMANMMGKVASFALSIAVFMTYFHDFFAEKVFYLDWIVMGIALLFAYIAFSNYFVQAAKILIILYPNNKLFQFVKRVFFKNVDESKWDLNALGDETKGETAADGVRVQVDADTVVIEIDPAAGKTEIVIEAEEETEIVIEAEEETEIVIEAEEEREIVIETEKETEIVIEADDNTEGEA